MLVDDELLAWRDDHWVGRRGHPRAAGSADDQLAPRRSPRRPARRRARSARPGVGRGHAVSLRCDSRDCSRVVRGHRRQDPRDARPPRRDPARSIELSGRRGVPLQAHPDPRRRLSIALEGGPGRPPRTVRRLARANSRSAAARVRGDRRLPPGAGVSLPQGHRLRRRGGQTTRCERVRAARVGRTQGPRAQRPSGRDPVAGRASDPGIVDDARRARLLPELGAALIGTGTQEETAERILAEATRLAVAAHDDVANAHALVQQQILLVFRAEDGATEKATRAVASVIPIFERHGDEHGLCRARRLQGLVQWNAARAAAAVESLEEAATHARLAGDEDERSEILSWVVTAMVFGPTPVRPRSAAARRFESKSGATRDRRRGRSVRSRASTQWTAASIARATSSPRATPSSRSSDRRATPRPRTSTGSSRCSPATYPRPKSVCSPATSCSRQMGDKAFRPTTAAHLAQALFGQGRDDEALHYTQISEELGADDDLLTQVVWRGVRRGSWQVEVGSTRPKSLLTRQWRSASGPTSSTLRPALSSTLRRSFTRRDRPDESNAAAGAALGLYEEKGNRVAARKVRRPPSRLVQEVRLLPAKGGRLISMSRSRLGRMVARWDQTSAR